MKVSHVSTTRTADNNLELKCNIDGSDVIIKKNSLSSLYLSANRGGGSIIGNIILLNKDNIGSFMVQDGMPKLLGWIQPYAVG